MQYTDQQIEDGITALRDRGVNTASAVRAVLGMMRANLASLVIPAGANFLFSSGKPDNAKGSPGDLCDNLLNGDRYQKQADGTWAFQYNAKGPAGKTPQKGVDYRDGYTPVKGVDYHDGVDGKSAYQLWLEAGNVGSVAVFLGSLQGKGGGAAGADGTIYHQENYDPAATDGNDGDIWQTSVSLTTERRYKKVAGQWRKFYDNTGTVAVVTPPNTAPSVLVTVGGTAQAPKFTVQAADADGIQSLFVKVYDSTGAAVATFGPSAVGDTSYVTSWSTAPAGSYTAKAIATDKLGLSATSDPLSFTVGAAASPAYPAEVFFVGDSKTAQPGPGGTSWANLMGLNTTQFPAAGLHIVAVSGESADQQLARVQTQILAARDASTYPQGIVWVEVGVNDLRIGDSGTPHAGQYRTKYQIAHDILEIGRLCRKAGLKPILQTFGPDRRNYQSNPTEDTREVNLMIDVNNLTLANATAYGYVAALDLTSDGFIGSPSAPINYAGTYWLNDLIHWNQAGEQYVADKAKVLTQQVAAAALPAWTDPGEYQVPATTNATSTGAGTGTTTPYALVSPVFAEAVNILISGNSLKGNGDASQVSNPNGAAAFWGAATSQNYTQATSDQVLAYIEYVIQDSNVESVIGWNNTNTTNSYQDIVYAWHFKAGAGIRPFGNGGGSLATGGSSGFTAAANNDVLRIQLERTRVVWLQNGAERYALPVSTVPTNYFLDMALAPGAVVNDIRIGAASWVPRPGVAAYAPPAAGPLARSKAVLQNGVNVSISGNTASKSGGSDGNFDAGFTGTTRFGASTASTKGTVDFLLTHASGGYLLGTHAGSDGGTDYHEITNSFAIQVSKDTAGGEVGWRSWLGGTPGAWTDFTDGDRLAIAFGASGTTIKAGSAAAVSVNYALPDNALLDASLYAAGAVVQDVYISADSPVPA